MFTLAQILCALVLPAALAALLAVLSRDVARGSGRMVQGLGGVLLAVVVVVAHAATASATEACLIPPHLGWHWLPWAAALLIPLYLWSTPPGWWRWTLHAAVTAGGAVLLLHPLSSSLSLPLIAAWAVGATLAASAGAWTTLRLHTTAPWSSHLAAVIALGGSAIALAATGSKDLALLAAIPTCAVIGSGLLARRDLAWAAGPAASAQLGAWYLMVGATYSDLPWWCALILALAVPAGALAASRCTSPKAAALVRCGVTAAVVILGIVLAATLGQPVAAASDGPEYHY